MNLRPITLAPIALAVLITPAWADLGNQLFKLTPDDGAELDYFGAAVAVDSGIAVVGAFRDQDNDFFSGSAYLFDVSSGTQLKKITANDGGFFDQFGSSVAANNGLALLGAPGDGDVFFSSGSAYLFDTATFEQLTKFSPADPVSDGEFGASVAIDGGVALIGARGDDDNGLASGSAYLFDLSTGAQFAKLSPDDGAPQDYFGTSAAISNGIAIIGSPQDDDNGEDSGSAYLFDAVTGVQIAKLTPQDGAEMDRFGESVAIDGGLALVGAYGHSGRSGAAYLFDVATGTQLAKIVADDGSTDDRFGRSVAISGGLALVGASYEDEKGLDSGSAYLFEVPTVRQIAKFSADLGGELDHFGSSVAIGDGIAIIGAEGDSNNGDFAGAAYIFSTVPEPSAMWLGSLAVAFCPRRRL
ncbi:hypothetical protein Pla108_30580 [Botrimarina colliarenosi]|uniref:FG-GAP repeat protein n=1 Tax=Botrimarina colliarenosi TaxID=2528001 RepID=A0A5C6A9A9_9BACT|nr:FG-GAP repeat protein [Botrimarina colliarenosi]TWT95980.1 hypothetical protein Pla108_30580 [Botrimarina colliarenosi]